MVPHNSVSTHLVVVVLRAGWVHSSGAPSRCCRGKPDTNPTRAHHKNVHTHKAPHPSLARKVGPNNPTKRTHSTLFICIRHCAHSARLSPSGVETPRPRERTHIVLSKLSSFCTVQREKSAANAPRNRIHRDGSLLRLIEFPQQ